MNRAAALFTKDTIESSLNTLQERVVTPAKNILNAKYNAAHTTFSRHPMNYNETYLEHLTLSLMQFLYTLLLALRQLFHAVFPFTLSKHCIHNEKKTEMSDYQMVRKFTKAAGTDCSNQPTLITKERGKFLIRHALSELHEFALTITSSTEEAHQLMYQSLGVDPSEWKERTQFELIEDQEDAICDTWVYMLNVAAEFGQDVSSMMKVVMKANMAKIDPITGKCNRRESDGKIMKPEGWSPPDTKGEITRQIEEGTNC